MNNILAFIQSASESSSNLVFIVGIQVFLFALFVIMLTILCKVLKKKEKGKSIKKTCILVWFMSAIAWFVIAQIVWILTSSQLSGG